MLPKNLDTVFFHLDVKMKILYCRGEWTLKRLMALKKALGKLELSDNADIIQIIDGKNIKRLDSSGALILQQCFKNFKQKNSETIENLLKNFKKNHLKLVLLISSYENNGQELPPRLKSPEFFEKTGLSAVKKIEEFRQFLNFLGEISVSFFKLLLNPFRLPWRSIISIIETTGIYALPIIALLSFLIGMVLAYQMGMQLKSYGANIYVVDVLGLSILREFSPLMTAIIVAGRSGSAFAAQLGTMKIREEIDALKTMGLSSADLLIVPKVAGLCLALPLLTVWSAVFAVAGGMTVADSALKISYAAFLSRFYQIIPVNAYFTGMIKTPVFGLIIGTIGCFQGMQVFGSAASVGEKTTKSVVQSIFFIIIIDAVFSIVFQWLGL